MKWESIKNGLAHKPLSSHTSMTPLSQALAKTHLIQLAWLSAVWGDKKFSVQNFVFLGPKKTENTLKQQNSKIKWLS